MNDETLDKVINEVLSWADEDELAATMDPAFRQTIRDAVREVLAGATLTATPLEQAREALVAALIAEEDATLAYEAEITDLPTMTDAEDAALVAMNDAICARHKASTAYRIALAGAK